jgi:hypothetical protein
LQNATNREDTESLNALQDLREELDQLAEFRHRDLEEYMGGGFEDDEDELDMLADGVEQDDAGIEDEEPEAEGVELGNEDMEGEESTVAAKKPHILPIRSSREHETPEVVEPPAEDEESTTTADSSKTLRKRKSTKFGGAFHAHAFSKSLSRGPRPRGSLLDIGGAATENKDEEGTGA